jgi:hypothetical protein
MIVSAIVRARLSRASRLSVVFPLDLSLGTRSACQLVVLLQTFFTWQFHNRVFDYNRNLALAAPRFRGMMWAIEPSKVRIT